MVTLNWKTAIPVLGAAGIMAGCAKPVPDCSSITVTNAWVRALPGGADVTAGYMIVRNRGANRVRLLEVESTDFSRASMHRTVRAGDRTRMEPISELIVPPGEKKTFEPGGLHIMLHEPRLDFQEGDRLELTLVCGEERGRFPFSATVRSNGSPAAITAP